MSRSFRFLLQYLFLAGLAAALPAQAQERFWNSVASEERDSCGVSKLAEAQQKRLGELIQRDLDAARQGDVTGFAKTFTQRRTARETEECGLGLLTEQERARLDALVANRMLSGGRSIVTTASRTAASDDFVEVYKRKGTVHGSVSFMVGTSGGGRNFYGGAADVSYTDPSGKTTTTVGYSYLKGKGLPCPYYDRAYGPWSPYWPDAWY